MIDCHDVMKRLWEYLDGELPPDEHTALREHIAMCARCNPQYRFQLTFLGVVAQAHAHETVRPEFASRLRGALAAAGLDSPS
jgi:anti-sigma factor (TIGR02949 family)